MIIPFDLDQPHIDTVVFPMEWGVLKFDNDELILIFLSQMMNENIFMALLMSYIG